MIANSIETSRFDHIGCEICAVPHPLIHPITNRWPCWMTHKVTDTLMVFSFVKRHTHWFSVDEIADEFNVRNPVRCFIIQQISVIFKYFSIRAKFGASKARCWGHRLRTENSSPIALSLDLPKWRDVQ